MTYFCATTLSTVPSLEKTHQWPRSKSSWERSFSKSFALSWNGNLGWIYGAWSPSQLLLNTFQNFPELVMIQASLLWLPLISSRVNQMSPCWGWCGCGHCWLFQCSILVGLQLCHTPHNVNTASTGCKEGKSPDGCYPEFTHFQFWDLGNCFLPKKVLPLLFLDLKS